VVAWEFTRYQKSFKLLDWDSRGGLSFKYQSPFANHLQCSAGSTNVIFKQIWYGAADLVTATYVQWPIWRPKIFAKYIVFF